MRGKICLAAVAFVSFLPFSLPQAHAAPVAQIGTYRPSTGQWFLDFSGNRAWDRCGPDGCMVQFGSPGDRPVVGDWNGDGTPEIGVYRPSTGSWFLDRNGNGFWDGCNLDQCLLQFGAPSDLPVAVDLSGDGVPEVGVFRPTTGQWFFDLDRSGTWSGCGLDRCLDQFGSPGDLPVATDINNDGTPEVGVYRPATGAWYFDMDHSGTWSGCGADGCFGSFGAPVDLPVLGAWNPLAGPGDPQNYFPFATGSTWTFQGTSTENGIFAGNFQNTITVSGTRVIDGVTTTIFSQSNADNAGPIDEYFLKDGRGITNWGNNDLTDTITPLLVAYQEVIFPMESGARFSQFQRSGLDLGDDLDLDGINERLDITSSIWQFGFTSVTVPAGIFSNCAEIHNEINLSGAFSSNSSIRFGIIIRVRSWFAPGVGLVKRETYTEGSLVPDPPVPPSIPLIPPLIELQELTNFSIAIPPPPPQILGNPIQIGIGVAPQIAVAANGEAVCVWENQGSIWANRYVPGEGWGIPALVEDKTELARAPKITIDPAGYATAAWIESYDLWVNRFTPGSGWGTPEMVETNPGVVSDPAIAADPNGYVTLVWRVNEEGYNSLWASRYEPGAGWDVPVRIEPPGGMAESPRIVVDANGNAIAVWYDRDVDFTFNDVWACRYVPGIGWGEPERIEGNAGAVTIGELAIGINPAGTAVVVWPQRDGGYQSLWANRYLPGAGWGTAELVEGNPNDTWFTDVAVSPDGSAIATWEQVTDINDTYPRHRWANRYAPGFGWETASTIENNPSYSSADGQIVIDLNGNATLVWHQGYDGTAIWSKRYIPGTDWGTQERVEISSAPVSSGLQIGVDNGGNVIVIWPVAGTTTGDGTIWANRY